MIDRDFENVDDDDDDMDNINVEIMKVFLSDDIEEQEDNNEPTVHWVIPVKMVAMRDDLHKSRIELFHYLYLNSIR